MANVTISLPEEVVRAARHLAVDEGLSLSQFVGRILTQQIEARGRYERAREEHLQLLDRGWHLDTHGQASWTRDELHDR
jgi:hypothetical protein